MPWMERIIPRAIYVHPNRLKDTRCSKVAILKTALTANRETTIKPSLRTLKRPKPTADGQNPQNAAVGRWFTPCLIKQHADRRESPHRRPHHPKAKSHCCKPADIWRNKPLRWPVSLVSKWGTWLLIITMFTGTPKGKPQAWGIAALSVVTHLPLSQRGASFTIIGFLTNPVMTKHHIYEYRDILCMDEILHHFETMGNCCLYLQVNHHSRLPVHPEYHPITA